MITQHGPQCDVCGNYILPGMSENVNPFSMTGISGTLLAHDACKPIILAACEAKDWSQLPDGPIRRAFESESK